MTEGGDARPDVGKSVEVHGGLDPKVISDFAKIGIRQLRKASLPYTHIRSLFKSVISEEEMKPVELSGSDWRWVFTRRPAKKEIDIEIRKFPLSGQGLLEHAIRLRTGKDPLVATDKIIRETGPESFENDEDAIAEVGAFISELLPRF